MFKPIFSTVILECSNQEVRLFMRPVVFYQWKMVNRYDSFLENNDDFELVEERTVDPGAHNDGFYMAKLKKK